MKKKNTSPLTFKNKRVYFDYEVLDKLESGIVLTGCEVKSIKNGKININGSFGIFLDNELYIRGIDIATYKEGSYNNIIDPKRDKKLLLHKKQLNKLKIKLDEKGLTIVPIKLYPNERGIFKLEIGVARGRKKSDKREYIKERDSKREMKDLL